MSSPGIASFGVGLNQVTRAEGSVLLRDLRH